MSQLLSTFNSKYHSKRISETAGNEVEGEQPTYADETPVKVIDRCVSSQGLRQQPGAQIPKSRNKISSMYGAKSPKPLKSLNGGTGTGTVLGFANIGTHASRTGSNFKETAMFVARRTSSQMSVSPGKANKLALPQRDTSNTKH